MLCAVGFGAVEVFQLPAVQGSLTRSTTVLAVFLVVDLVKDPLACSLTDPLLLFSGTVLVRLA